MLAIAIRLKARGRGEEIHVINDARHLGVSTYCAKAAAIHTQQVFGLGCVGRRRHKIDRAAEARAAILQSVAAAINLDMLQSERIHFLKVAAAVGVIQRNPVLQKLDAAQVITTAETRAANAEAHFLSITLASENTGREGERVLQIGGIFVFELIRRHNANGTGHFGEISLCFGNAGSGQRARFFVRSSDAFQR